MPEMSRRAIFKTGAALAVGASAMSLNPIAAAGDDVSAKAPSSAPTFGHTIAYGDEYHKNILPIMEAVRKKELPVIAEVADRMAATVKNGHKVWMQAKQGHLCRHEFDMANRGNPGLFQSDSEWDDTDYDKMQSGDMLVTNYINDNVAAVRKSGVYVVGVTVCYQDSPAAPRGVINPNANGWFLSDVSDIIIDSHSPWEQGIVSCAQIPEMKICPSSANPLTAIFWMLTAEGANRLKNSSDASAPFAAKYLDTVIERIRASYPPQRDALFGAAVSAAERIISGAHYHVTSDHRGVEQESAGVASGPMMTNAFKKEMKSGDVHLLATIEPDSPKIIEAATAARDMGQYILAIGPAGSTRLAALADVFIDNYCPEGGGLLDIPGYSEKIATASSILSNVLMWIFTGQMVDEMTRRGTVPWFWMGYYLKGGAEYDDAVRPLFMRQGF